jgi:Tfp pilus assembly protein FimT
MTRTLTDRALDLVAGLPNTWRDLRRADVLAIQTLYAELSKVASREAGRSAAIAQQLRAAQAICDRDGEVWLTAEEKGWLAVAERGLPAESDEHRDARQASAVIADWEERSGLADLLRRRGHAA